MKCWRCTAKRSWRENQDLGRSNFWRMSKRLGNRMGDSTRQLFWMLILHFYAQSLRNPTPLRTGRWGDLFQIQNAFRETLLWSINNCEKATECPANRLDFWHPHHCKKTMLDIPELRKWTADSFEKFKQQLSKIRSDPCLIENDYPPNPLYRCTPRFQRILAMIIKAVSQANSIRISSQSCSWGIFPRKTAAGK